MSWVADNIALIPLLPLLAAGILALLPASASRLAVRLAVAAMTAALILSVLAFGSTLVDPAPDGHALRTVRNFVWFDLGTSTVRLGFLLDPLSAVMLIMVSLIGLLIFIYSMGYMAGDPNVTRFFCFLSLFASAMLGLVVSNSLLLLFACWELMGVASYLLIGFWYYKPEAAAAAQKAFIVTRIGDLGLFLGMIWLYQHTGTLLFYDEGNGCLEATAIAGLATPAMVGAMTVATAISSLIFLGAMGKSGQVPLHVWLPDAMEGPTPVSALIHAATMVAAGVFLVARVFPIMAGGLEVPITAGSSPALNAVTAIGAITAAFGALLAVAQTDIKRILAYSTVSQLGYMFLGLGTGGVAVGMFHLVTHAFFKALLFLGAGSVIHGCHGEQDIRRMGGLRRWMPWTFATYAVGMMALSGVPFLFSGFWSKDEILHAAWIWQPAKWPFALALGGAFLTAFYMTRQVAEVFFGPCRVGSHDTESASATHASGSREFTGAAASVHESPPAMLIPLGILAVLSILLGMIGTPAWPWFESYLSGHSPEYLPQRLRDALPMMLVSTGVVTAGIGLGWLVYGRRPRAQVDAPDPVEATVPRIFGVLRRRLYVDEAYDVTVVSGHRASSDLTGWADGMVIGGLVAAVGLVLRGFAWVARWVDEVFVNPGFDAGCATVKTGGGIFSRLQAGRLQWYLGGLVLGMAMLSALVIWGLRS